MEKVRSPLWLAAFVLCASLVILYRGPQYAATLAIQPDSVEYAASAIQLAQGKAYAFTINTTQYPPRYSPLFAPFALAPLYAVLGADPGNGVYAVLCFALIGVLCAAMLGWQCAGKAGLLFAPLLLLCSGLYRIFSGEIMADVPALAGMLMVAVVFVSAKSTLSPRMALIAALGACCALFQSAGVFACVPLAVLCARFPKRALFLILPPVALLLFVAVYQWHTFGDPLRTGYHYWTPYPYQFFSETFSLRFLVPNLKVVLFHTDLPFIVGSVVVALIAWRQAVMQESPEQRTRCGQLVCFILITVVPQSCVYLAYFFSSNRFFLPLISCSHILIGILLAKGAAHYFGEKRAVMIGVSSMLFFGVGWGIYQFSAARNRPGDEIVREIIGKTESDALIVSDINPAYLTLRVGVNSHRTVVPYSRSAEYASKLIAPFPLNLTYTQVKECHNHRCEVLVSAGAQEVFPVVVQESNEILIEELVAGRAVYFAGHLTDEQKAELEQDFTLARNDSLLYRLSLKQKLS